MLRYYHWLNKFINFSPRTQKTIIENKIVYNNAIHLYNALLTIYLNQYNSITNKEKEDIDKKYDVSKLLTTGYRFNLSTKKDEQKSKSEPEETDHEIVKLTRQKADDKDLSDLLPLEGYEEVKEEKD